MFDHTRTLMQWRKTSEAVTKGKLMHFMPFGDLVNTYVYFRYTPDFRDFVMVVINNGTESVSLDWAHYAEIFDAAAAALGTDSFTATDILTGATVSRSTEPLAVPGMTSLRRMPRPSWPRIRLSLFLPKAGVLPHSDFVVLSGEGRWYGAVEAWTVFGN